MLIYQFLYASVSHKHGHLISSHFTFIISDQPDSHQLELISCVWTKYKNRFMIFMWVFMDNNGCLFPVVLLD